MKIVKEEKGQILVFTALSVAVLLGFVGLATDVGQLFHVKRHLQTVADAAATAGALYDSYGEPADAAGIAAAKANGVDDGVNGASVVINEPPAHGPNKLQPGFVEAIVSVPNNTIFMGFSGTPTVSVTARAVAGVVPGRACMYFMNESGVDFQLQGSATVEAPGGKTTCGIYSNSTSSDSVSVAGTANDVNTAYVGTMGGLQSSGTSVNSNTGPTPTTTGVPSMSPPDSLDLSSYLPDPSTYCTTSNTYKASGAQLQNVRGTKYIVLLQSDLPSGSTLSGATCISSSTGNVMLQGDPADPSGTLTLPAGLYVFPGQVGIGNNVTGKGITLDINGDSGPTTERVLTVNATTQVTLDAPAPGSKSDQGCTAPGGACYSVIFAAPSTNDETFFIQWGSSSASATSCQSLSASTADGLGFSGLIDAPAVNVVLQDQGGYALLTGMVVGSMNLNTGFLCVDNYAEANRYSPMTTISLVE